VAAAPNGVTVVTEVKEASEASAAPRKAVKAVKAVAVAQTADHAATKAPTPARSAPATRGKIGHGVATAVTAATGPSAWTAPTVPSAAPWRLRLADRRWTAASSKRLARRQKPTVRTAVAVGVVAAVVGTATSLVAPRKLAYSRSQAVRRATVS
jgi:hypothetical protein